MSIAARSACSRASTVKAVAYKSGMADSPVAELSTAGEVTLVPETKQRAERLEHGAVVIDEDSGLAHLAW